MTEERHMPEGPDDPQRPRSEVGTDRPRGDGALDTEQRREAGNGLAIAAIVFGLGAVVFAPIILGPIGIILAVMARNRGQPLGNAALWIAIGGTVVGLVFGLIAAQMVMDDGTLEGAHPGLY